MLFIGALWSVAIVANAATKQATLLPQERIRFSERNE